MSIFDRRRKAMVTVLDRNLEIRMPWDADINMDRVVPAVFNEIRDPLRMMVQWRTCWNWGCHVFAPVQALGDIHRQFVLILRFSAGAPSPDWGEERIPVFAEFFNRDTRNKFVHR